MRKILIAFDGDNFSEGVLGFAQQLNEKDPILLTAAFLPQIDYANLWSYSPGGQAGAVYIPLMEDEEAKVVKKSIDRFESFCIKNHIEHRVHKDFFDFAVPGLKKETRYADVLIISSSTFYKQVGSDAPNEYLKEILHQAECPVIIVPEKFDFPNSNILAFDGSESAVYAIKQFAYLFPELTNNETLLFYIKDNRNDEFPEEKNIEELAARHFSNLTLMKFHEDFDRYFSTWLMDKKGSVLISGAYGRSGFSRVFKKSFVNEIISDHKLPVFIAHK
jgi:hypothetical protein